MLISFILSYSETFFVVFYVSFFFVLGQDPSVRCGKGSNPVVSPYYVMGEDSPAPQCIFVEESPVPMSGVKCRLCLVLESPEPTGDRAVLTSLVPMSGTKDRPFLMDDPLAVPKGRNVCWGGGKPVEGG